MARAKTAAQHDVSTNNPCPFLRALVASGQLADDTESLAKVANTISKVASRGEGSPSLPRVATYAVAAIANGLSPLSIARANLAGLKLNALRDGPLDKHGVGSGILNAKGQVNKAELIRLDEFASEKQDGNGNSERGLNAAELKRMMDANFERAAGRRRRIDRTLMDGEWPVLLKVMGKGRGKDRYLSLAELRVLFVERRLPKRMTSASG